MKNKGDIDITDCNFCNGNRKELIMKRILSGILISSLILTTIIPSNVVFSDMPWKVYASEMASDESATDLKEVELGKTEESNDSINESQNESLEPDTKIKEEVSTSEQPDSDSVKEDVQNNPANEGTEPNNIENNDIESTENTEIQDDSTLIGQDSSDSNSDSDLEIEKKDEVEEDFLLQGKEESFLDSMLNTQTLTNTSSSNEVIIEGNLPEGAKVSVTELNTEDYLSVLAEYYNTSVENVFCVSALDITIETVDGQEFQPKDYNETVTVTIQDVEVTENAKEVIHIEETALDSVSTMLAENTYTEFETDSFSVYLIGGVSYDTSNAEFLDNDYASAYLFSDGRLLVTAFKKSNNNENNYPWYSRKDSIKTVSFADSVTFIGNFAFYKCSGLTGDLVIPNSVTFIGLAAFHDCSGLTGDLVIPNSVTSIGDSAFKGCSGFTGNLVIPDSVTSIGEVAFHKCSGFTGDLVIPDSVTTIDNRVFYGCSGFNGTLTLPNSVTTIGDYAFAGCSKYTGNLIIPDSVTTVGQQAFYKCSGLTDITIGTGITEIGTKAFYVTDKTLTKLDTENEVALAYDWAGSNRIVGAYVLSTDGSLLGTLNESTGVLTVSGTGTALDIKLKDAMGEDTSLVKGLYFESTSVESICADWCDNSEGAFPNLGGTLDLPDSVTTIGNSAFNGCSGFTGDLVIPNSVTTIGDLTFSDCSGFTGNLVIPNSVTTIGKWAFTNCYNLTGDLNIPDSVTTIGSYAFQYCSRFTGTLTLPDNITSIGNGAFYKCSGFTEPLFIPNSVTTIGDSAFALCDGITEITVGTYSNGFLGIGAKNNSKLTSIGDNAFYARRRQITTLNAKKQNTALNYDWAGDNRILSGATSCTFYMNTEETLVGTLNLSTGELVITGDGKALDLTLDKTVGNLPLKSLNFQTQTVEGICAGWAGSYKNPEGISGTLNLPSNLKVIGEGAFAGCSGFTGTLTIPNSVTTMYNAAFLECSGFTGDLVIPDSVTVIGVGAFGACSNLGPTLTIPESVTTIADMAFLGCNKITSIKTADNGTPITIGEGAFLCADLNQEGDPVPVSTPIKTKLYSTNESVLNYDWAGDMRDIELGLKKYTLNTEGTLFGYLDTDTGVLTVNGTGTDLDLTLATAMGDDTSIVKSIIFDTDNLEVIKDSWCDNNAGAFPNLQGTLILPSTLKEIKQRAFQGCSGLTGDLIIPDSVAKVGKYAFQGCSGFDGKLKLSNSMTTIYGRSFSDCSGLIGDLVIPNSVTAIQYCAFSKCTGFTGSLSISDSVTIIQEYAFDGCSNLTGSLKLPSALETIGNAAFKNCNKITGNLSIPKGVTTIGDEAFYYCSGLSGQLSVPNTVTALGNKTFSNCDNLTKLYIGNGVATVGENCFYVDSTVNTKLFTKSAVVKEYLWNDDNRNVSSMNTFVIGLPQEITLNPKYLNATGDPIWYASFNMEIVGDFEDGSYGSYNGTKTFSIGSESGSTREVSSDLEDSTVTENGTTIISVVLTAPDPDLSEEYTGVFDINTVLHEKLPSNF